MVELSVPQSDTLRAVNDVSPDDFPPFAYVKRHRDPPRVRNLEAAATEAIDDISTLDTLSMGAEIAITAGSRGIHDMPAFLEAVVTELSDRGFKPYIIPAMGSHGGATAEGQVEMLNSLGITETSVGCEIRSSMDVNTVGEDERGKPVFAAVDALNADAVLLANRVKLHTDYNGAVESGLCKMAVVGLGKHRGAEVMHNAALDRGFENVIPERAEILLEETNIVGGLALLENANERAGVIEGVPADEILTHEPELLERSEELFPTLPVDDLDLLIVDEFGKDISGTGLDTNVIGRVNFHNQAEPDSPSITRVYVRSLTPASHGNALGVGLADFAHEDVAESIELTDMYVNIATSGEPNRAKIPFLIPSDAMMFVLAASTTGTPDPENLRIARIQNTMEPDTLQVSKPVADELRGRDNVEIGELTQLSFNSEGNIESELR
ncbi:beta-ketoacyl-[acyl-carrier-protein] synthase family protein [Haloarcula amylovorans]|uniref:DUF362 domain-containing protein n=1 Tax=Haloarcula amylovorans TaxID=2562280 RepID=UPI0010765B86|nr:DUF362 domain-containing protein [Halomicroarcula amylolytica]